MNRIKKVSWATAAAMLLLSSPALAQQTAEQPMPPEQTQPAQSQGWGGIPGGVLPFGVGLRAMRPVPSGIGIQVLVGGSVNGYLGKNATNVTSVGGGWNVRVGIGTRLPVSIEAAYMGTANSINALGLSPNAILLGNGAEAVVRVNILPGMIQPFIFAGVGWRHYSIVNKSYNTSDISNQDNVGQVPVGGGVMVRLMQFIIDARATFRPTWGTDMLPSGSQLHMWSADLNFGGEF